MGERSDNKKAPLGYKRGFLVIIQCKNYSFLIAGNTCV